MTLNFEQWKTDSMHYPTLKIIIINKRKLNANDLI